LLSLTAVRLARSLGDDPSSRTSYFSASAKIAGGQSWALAILTVRNTSKAIAWVGSAMLAAFAVQRTPQCRQGRKHHGTILKKR
jgi:hypothetical protein